MLSIVLLVNLFFWSNAASADLLISPMRIVFNERDRVQEVILVNTADDVRTYSMSWSELLQKENQSYRRLNEAEKAQFAKASDYIRFSPRRFTLQPGENQRVKLSLRRRSGMSAPEYRSHLKFTIIPNEVMLQQQKEEEVDGVAIKLNLFLNYSIPVMIKNGDSANARVTEASLVRLNNDPNPAEVVAYVEKSAPVSVIGDVTIWHKAYGEVEYSAVGYNNNVSMYHETNRVRLSVPWVEPKALVPGEMKITYKGKRESADTLSTELVFSVN